VQKARGTARTQKFRHLPKASVNCFPARSAADGGVMRVQAIGAVVRIDPHAQQSAPNPVAG